MSRRVDLIPLTLLSMLVGLILALFILPFIIMGMFPEWSYYAAAGAIAVLVAIPTGIRWSRLHSVPANLTPSQHPRLQVLEEPHQTKITNLSGSPVFVAYTPPGHDRPTQTVRLEKNQSATLPADVSIEARLES